uniref:Uncharacterized protein n=1 Tax=Panagrolaimus davidi TaxID=227884 RepID=A0A914Q6N2_9BILA
MVSPDFFNRTISSAAFFFQCPKCVLAHRIHLKDSENEKPVLWYEIINIENSIPSGAKKCETVWGISCKLDKNYLIKNSPKSFSQRVLPFVIAAENDEEFCG